MKNIFKLLPILILIAACEVVELNSPNNGSNEENELIGNGQIDASDSVTFRRKISGTNDKNWITAEFTLAGSDNLTFCRLDDKMIFNDNGSYTYNGGNTLCGAEDNRRVRTGTWELDYKNHKIIFDRGSSNEYIAEIIGLTDNEIRLKGSYFNLEVRGKYIVE